ncbi:hypothetical protein IG631_00321 [Alternaria alternata]|nr:hypothetical protein IG631_00321 [Alternaria alternata]
MEGSQRWLGALLRRAPCWYLDSSQTVCVVQGSFLGYSTIISNRVADDSQVLLRYGIFMAHGRQTAKSVSKDSAVSEGRLPSFYTLSAWLALHRGVTYYDRQQPSRTAASHLFFSNTERRGDLLGPAAASTHPPRLALPLSDSVLDPWKQIPWQHLSHLAPNTQHRTTSSITPEHLLRPPTLV